jgi:predicted ATPase
MFEAELYRLKGELLLMRATPDASEAERCLRSAIDVARVQSALSWELRATTSLARLLADNGRRDEAPESLAAIHGRFTEGFETADLKDAQTMLERLRSA